MSGKITSTTRIIPESEVPFEFLNRKSDLVKILEKMNKEEEQAAAVHRKLRASGNRKNIKRLK